jgi:hypothetical protein
MVKANVKKENLKPKAALYPMLIFVCFLVFCLYQVVDTWQQECDYSTDTFILLCLGCMWVTQPRHLRHRDFGPMAVLIVSYKLVYFIDREQSFNF